jgi:hypothetical protein
MKKISSIVLMMLACGQFVNAQDSIVYRTESLEEINLRFELPTSAWSKANIAKTKNDASIYTYTRTVFRGKKKDKQATFSIFVEKVKPSTSIREYSLKGLRFFEQQKDFKLNKAFTDSDGRFSIPYTIGYDAEYSDQNGVKHHLYILHTIEFNHAAQMLLDFPVEYQEEYEDEQLAIMKSLRYERF